MSMIRNGQYLINIGMDSSDYFSFSVHESGKKTTKHFSNLVKVSSLLLLLDRYLLSNFKVLKQQVSHVLLKAVISEGVTILEETSYEGEIGEIVRCYLKSAKELILSSLVNIETTSDLDNLLKKLSVLVYQTQEQLRTQDFLEVLSCSSLDKIGLARIIHHYWLYFSKSGSTAPIIIESITGAPKVMFRQEPPLREWIRTINENTQPGKLELRHVDFGDNTKWKAVLFDYIHDRPMVVEVKDLKFLESLKSTEDNEVNGILHGDIILARYSITNDVLLNKTTIKILEVHKRLRRSQATQLNLFTADVALAASEPSPVPVPEKKQKNVKKKHSSWSRRS